MTFSGKIKAQVEANRAILVHLPHKVHFVNEWVPETLSYKLAIQFGTTECSIIPERKQAPWSC